MKKVLCFVVLFLLISGISALAESPKMVLSFDVCGEKHSLVATIPPDILFPLTNPTYRFEDEILRIVDFSDPAHEASAYYRIAFWAYKDEIKLIVMRETILIEPSPQHRYWHWDENGNPEEEAFDSMLKRVGDYAMREKNIMRINEGVICEEGKGK